MTISIGVYNSLTIIPVISLISLSPPIMDHSQNNYPSEFSTTLPDGEDISHESTLAGARAAVAELEESHRSKGTKLSGRIIHVTHYLPIITTLNQQYTSKDAQKPISPPKTPLQDIVSLEAEKAHKPGDCLPNSSALTNRATWLWSFMSSARD